MTDAEARKRKLNAELANGRLAMMPSLECSTRMAPPAPPGETGPCMWTRRSGLLKVLCTGPMINNGFHHLDTTNTKKVVRSLLGPFMWLSAHRLRADRSFPQRMPLYRMQTSGSPLSNSPIRLVERRILRAELQ